MVSDPGGRGGVLVVAVLLSTDGRVCATLMWASEVTSEAQRLGGREVV